MQSCTGKRRWVDRRPVCVEKGSPGNAEKREGGAVRAWPCLGLLFLSLSLCLSLSIFRVSCCESSV